MLILNINCVHHYSKKINNMFDFNNVEIGNCDILDQRHMECYKCEDEDLNRN